LDVKKGIVVLTKCDLVDDEWLTLVEEEVREALKELCWKMHLSCLFPPLLARV